MGIKDFGKIMKDGQLKYHQPICVTGDINTFGQETLALDIMCYIYEIMSRATKMALEQCEPFEEPPINAFLPSVTENWFKRFVGVNVICCWDGPNKPLKAHTQEKRAAAEAKIKADIEKAISIGDLRGYKNARTNYLRPTKEQIEIVKNTIEDIGYTNVQADGEGELECCRLQRDGKVIAVISKDSDCFVFGASLVIKDIKDNSQCTMYFREKVIDCIFPEITDLQLKYQAFYTLCCLVGNDFIERVYMRGPAKVRSLIFKHINMTNSEDPHDLLRRCVTDPEQKAVNTFEDYKEVYDMFVKC